MKNFLVYLAMIISFNSMCYANCILNTRTPQERYACMMQEQQMQMQRQQLQMQQQQMWQQQRYMQEQQIQQQQMLRMQQEQMNRMNNGYRY